MTKEINIISKTLELQCAKTKQNKLVAHMYFVLLQEIVFLQYVYI